MTGGGAPDKTFGIDNGDPDNGCKNGPSATVMCGPESVAVDAAGNLYVADTYNNRVLVFYNPDTDASPLTADLVVGQAPGNFTTNTADYDAKAGDNVVDGFCYVRGLALDVTGNLFVVDESNHRVVKFEKPLTTDTAPDLVLGKASLGDIDFCPTYDSKQTAKTHLNWPLGVAVDKKNNVYVTDMRNDRVLRFDDPQANGPAASQVYTGFNWPHDVAVDPAGNLYVADPKNKHVVVFADGATGDTTPDHEFPGLNYPMGMAFDAKGNLYLADCGAPAPKSDYPPCVSDPRGVYIFNAPATPTMTPTATSSATPSPTPTATTSPTPDPRSDVVLRVDVATGRAPISSDIYGMNEYGMKGDAAGFMQSLHIPLRRWGGNATTRYNYKNDISNHAFDWYFGNVKESNATDLPNDSAVNRFIAQNRQAGADSLLVVPMTGFVANGNATACGFSVAKYGAQKATAAQDGRPDCGNGIRTNGTPITNNDTLDTSIAVTESFVSEWVGFLKQRYGAADHGGIRFYNLDNEPDIWFESHRDLHPAGWNLAWTYDQFRDLTYRYGAAIKRADPSAAVLGPVVNGWTYYWYSAYDGQRQDRVTPDDRNAHGGMPFVPWYLQQMNLYEQQHGVRILDYLDLHYYPQSGVSLTGAGDAALQAKRLRSTRSLWDPSYVDESWIKDAGPDNGVVRLIPRMHEWVNQYYPSTKLAIGEYNWGALDHINGALAQADVLGIFGREGLDLATLWEPPQPNQPGAYAFRIYRNYDGNGSQFGDIRTRAISSDQSKLAVYAAQRSRDDVVTLVIINKSGNALNGQVLFNGFQPVAAAKVYRYSAANINAIVHEADQPVAGGGFSANFPANSITLLAIGSQPSKPTPETTPSGSGGNQLYLPSTRR